MLHELQGVSETFFDDVSFPETAEALQAGSAALKLDDKRPEPFTAKTLPFVHLSVQAYGERISKWLHTVKEEKEAPTHEQMRILQLVSKMQTPTQHFSRRHHRHPP